MTNDNIKITGYRIEDIAEDHYAIDGYKAEVLISSDSLVYLQKINEVVIDGERLWFKSLVTCRYDPITGEEFA